MMMIRISRGWFVALIAAASLTACTIYEGPPGGRVTVVPGYDYSNRAPADESEPPTLDDTRELPPNDLPGAGIH